MECPSIKNVTDLLSVVEMREVVIQGGPAGP